MKAIRLSDGAELRLIGEVFNILNTSNLTNFSYNLVVPATFGKANQRVGQTFGRAVRGRFNSPRASAFKGRVGRVGQVGRVGLVSLIGNEISQIGNAGRSRMKVKSERRKAS